MLIKYTFTNKIFPSNYIIVQELLLTVVATILNITLSDVNNSGPAYRNAYGKLTVPRSLSRRLRNKYTGFADSVEGKTHF